MKEIIDYFINEYKDDKTLLVDSTKNYYKKYVKDLPELLYKYFNRDKYLIKASIGVGQKCEIPWLCIFNKEITETAQKGIYICYLFRNDMSGFYVELGQGITVFDEKYGINKYAYINKVAEYFRDLINDEKFSREKINLRGTGKLAKGYENGTIISKFYEKNNFSENELLKDLSDLKKIYDEICENMVDESYNDIVENVIHINDPLYLMAADATRMIENTLLKESGLDEAFVVNLEETEIPISKKKNKYSIIKQKKIKKIDYLKKAKTNAENGLIGEELVLTYERERLKKINREDLANEVKWVSEVDDTIGYDILSFDVDENNNVVEKYIEVKSTEGNDSNVFFISINEIQTMEKLSEQYYLYRLYDIKSDNPKFFILNYNDFKEKIELTPQNYVANIKTVY